MKSSSLIDKGTSSIECHYSALGEKLCVVDKKKMDLDSEIQIRHIYGQKKKNKDFSKYSYCAIGVDMGIFLISKKSNF